MGSTVKDANHFYGLTVEYEEKTYYMLEILISCWKRAPNLQQQLRALALWLQKENPALISKNPVIIPIYEVSRVGPYFSMEHCCELISALQDGTYKVEKQLQYIKSLMHTTSELNHELVAMIQKMYAIRWETVIDTVNDYTRSQKEKNKPWIRLAQYLAGADLIPANYYRMLMPTLTQDKELVLDEPITSFPLSSFLLAENNEQLIYLPQCVSHFNANGTFYKLSPKPTPLSQKEKGRIIYANSHFVNFFNQFENEQVDHALSKSTIKKIQEFVNGSLYPIGLLSGYEYNIVQMEAAAFAYQAFLDFLKKLAVTDAIEYSNLNSHRVLFWGKRLTFAAIMKDIQEGGCVALNSRYLLKLVIDYAPQAHFSERIEKKMKDDLEDMRLCSSKKTYRDYELLAENEMAERVFTIFVSLMTHQFELLLFTGVTLKWEGCINKTTETGNELFQVIEPFLQKGASADFRKIYANIIENVIQPALANKGIKKSFTRLSDTLSWLQSIYDESIFKGNRLCFDPAKIVLVLESIAKNNAWHRDKIRSFITVLNRGLEVKKDPDSWIKLNILWVKWLRNSNEFVVRDALNLLRDTDKSIKPVATSNFAFFSNSSQEKLTNLSYSAPCQKFN